MPDWMDRASYEQIPESMSLRLIQVQVQEPGFRVESLWVVTTLTNAQKYPREDLADLFAKYLFRLLPVVDEQDHLLGVIKYHDILSGIITRAKI